MYKIQNMLYTDSTHKVEKIVEHISVEYSTKKLHIVKDIKEVRTYTYEKK